MALGPLCFPKAKPKETALHYCIDFMYVHECSVQLVTSVARLTARVHVCVSSQPIPGRDGSKPEDGSVSK